MMDRYEFIEKYCKASNLTRQEFDKYFVALPCNCDADNCEGWASIRASKDIIKDHIELYWGDK